MLRALWLSALLTLSGGAAFAQTSTINPALPAAGLPYSSSVIRNQFISAYNDLNALGATSSAYVATNAALAASSTLTFPNGVWRNDYSAGLGAPPLFYVPQAGNCAANSLVNDGGSCVNATNGGSFKARFDANSVDLRQWGADQTGAADSAAALQAALNYVKLSGVKLAIPGGTFKSTVAVTYAFASGVASLSIECAGPDATNITFPNATNGIVVTTTSSFSQVHLSGCSITTGGAGSGSGLLLTQNANLLGAPMVGTSDLNNVVFRGADGYILNNYWGAGVKIVGWSNVNYFNVNFFGANGGSVPLGTGGVAGPLGFGVTLEGNTSGGANTIAAVHNFVGSYFSGVQYGIIYGTDVQGVTVHQTQFTGIGINGILVGCPATATVMYSTDYLTPASCTIVNVDQLTVTDTQFGYNGGSSILSGYNIGHLMFANNLFYQAGVNHAIDIYGALETTITGNTFQVLNDTKTKTFSAFTGAIAATTLTASSVTNAIKVGDTVYAGPSSNAYPITPGTVIVAQLTGPTGGAGTYTVSKSQSVSSRAMNSYPVIAGVGVINAYGSSQGGTITGNHFTQVGKGVYLSASAQNFVVSGNRYDFVGNKVDAPAYVPGFSTPVNSVCDASTAWTVSLYSGATLETISSGIAFYMRCGNQVSFTFGFNNPTIGGTGAATIRGFPFVATNNMGVLGAGFASCQVYTNLNGATGIGGSFTSNTAILNLSIPGAATPVAASNATWNANSTIQCSGSYYTDAP